MSEETTQTKPETKDNTPTWKDTLIRVETLIEQALALGTTNPLEDARFIIEQTLNGPGAVQPQPYTPKPLVSLKVASATIVNKLIQQFDDMQGWRELWREHPLVNQKEVMERMVKVVVGVLEGKVEEGSESKAGNPTQNAD